MSASPSQVGSHDRLCPQWNIDPSLDCECYLLSRVREDERERIAQALTDLGYDYPAEVARNGGNDD